MGHADYGVLTLQRKWQLGVDEDEGRIREIGNIC